MKETNNNNKYLVEFNSIEEFYKYIKETPINDAFLEKKLAGDLESERNGSRFSGTESFDEAVSLLKNGDKDIAKKLTQKIKAKSIGIEHAKKAITTYDVCGYQASVPRYLQGVPTNMINKKMVMQKQKVIVINKDVGYAARIKKEQIIEESVKAFEIIKKIEAQGIRVVLNVIWGASEKGKSIVCKIRAKSANERLNISKMAFIMCHPSMLRRILLRFEETYPEFTESFTFGYGYPMKEHNKEFCKNEYFLPALMGNVNVENVNDMNVFKA